VITVDLNSLLGVLTSRPGVLGPPRYNTWDWAAAQRSIAALAAWSRESWPPAIIGFGSSDGAALRGLDGGALGPPAELACRPARSSAVHRSCGDRSVEELAAIAEFYPVFRITTIGIRDS
jgi:hypothetical protein